MRSPSEEFCDDPQLNHDFLVLTDVGFSNGAVEEGAAGVEGDKELDADIGDVDEADVEADGCTTCVDVPDGSLAVPLQPNFDQKLRPACSTTAVFARSSIA